MKFPKEIDKLFRIKYSTSSGGGVGDDDHTEATLRTRRMLNENEDFFRWNVTHGSSTKISI